MSTAYLEKLDWRQIADKVLDVTQLKRTLNERVKELSLSEWSEEGMLVLTFVSGSHGVHIPECFYKELGLNMEEMCKAGEEWYWEEFDDVCTKFVEGTIELLDSLNIRFPNHHLWIGTLEADGSLCLMIGEDQTYRLNKDEFYELVDREG